MKNLNKKVVVITGAASGIGQYLAIQLADLGCSLAISDINEEGLKETVKMINNKNVKVSSHYLDVADRDAVFKHADEVAKMYSGVDVIINNAGGVVVDKLETISYEDFQWQMNVNFWGVVNGTQAFLPYLRKRSQGHIVNVSSIYGIAPGVCVGAYNASKYAVKGFNESLACELRKTPIKVTSVHPGGIKTAFARAGRFRSGLDPNVDKHAMVYTHDNWRFITKSETAAAIIIKAIKKEKPRVMVGPDAVIFDWFARTFPKAIGPVMSFADAYYYNKYNKWVKKGKIKKEYNESC